MADSIRTGDYPKVSDAGLDDSWYIDHALRFLGRKYDTSAECPWDGVLVWGVYAFSQWTFNGEFSAPYWTPYRMKRPGRYDPSPNMIEKHWSVFNKGHIPDMLEIFGKSIAKWRKALKIKKPDDQLTIEDMNECLRHAKYICGIMSDSLLVFKRNRRCE